MIPTGFHRALAGVLIGLLLSAGEGSLLAGGAQASHSPSAESSPPESEAQTLKEGDGEPEYPLYGFHQILEDGKYLVQRPLHPERRGAIKLAAVAGITGILYLLRNRIRDRSQDHKNESRSDFLDDIRTMGKVGFGASLALIAYGSSFITHDEREKETAVLLLESMGYTGVGVGVGQFVLASERPYLGNEVNFFRRNGHGVSGDAALAASLVHPLRCQYLEVQTEDGKGRRFWKRLTTGILYAGAGLTAYQRVDSDRHWAPDAFLGMAAGLSVGGALCDSHERARQKGNEWKLRNTDNGFGLTIRF